MRVLLWYNIFMNLFLVLPYYFAWHYSRAILDIKDNAKNFIVFVYNLFSIPELVSTLFSPWMRIKDGYNVNNLLETFVFNSMMRVFGVFVRLIFILLGIFSLVVVTVSSMLAFLIWFFLPAVMVMIFVWSIGQFM